MVLVGEQLGDGLPHLKHLMYPVLPQLTHVLTVKRNSEKRNEFVPSVDARKTVQYNTGSCVRMYIHT